MTGSWKGQIDGWPDVLRCMPDDSTVIRAGAVVAGSGKFAILPGPCPTEIERQPMESAQRAAVAGARVLRGGAFHVHIAPCAFRCIGLEGLQLPARAEQATGLATVTEVITAAKATQAAQYADILRIGCSLDGVARHARPRSADGCLRRTPSLRGLCSRLRGCLVQTKRSPRRPLLRFHSVDPHFGPGVTAALHGETE